SSRFVPPVLAHPEQVEGGGERLLERGEIQAVDDSRALSLRDDQPRLLEHGEMSREGRLREREPVGELARGEVARFQQAQDLPTSGITESAEHFVQQRISFVRYFANYRIIRHCRPDVPWARNLDRRATSGHVRSGSRLRAD